MNDILAWPAAFYTGTLSVYFALDFPRPVHYPILVELDVDDLSEQGVLGKLVNGQPLVPSISLDSLLTGQPAG